METKNHHLAEQTLFYGMITGASVSVYLLILFISNIISWMELYAVKAFFSIEYLLLLAGIIWCGYELKKQSGEEGLTYGRVFLGMLFTGIWAGLMASVLIFIWAEFFQPDLQEIMVARIKEALLTVKPELSEKGYSDILNFATRFTSPSMEFSMSLIYYIKISAFFALILAAFFRRKRERAL